MSNQLLPCPFCGHDEPTHDEGDLSAWVQCTNLECGMCGPIASGPSLAAAAWNRRAAQPAVTAEFERLSSENAELKVNVERLEATVQEERQLRAKVGRIAHYLNEFASGRSTFSRIQEINDAIQGVPNGN